MEIFLEILKIIGVIATGVATAIPLIIKLTQTFEELKRSRNWSKLVGIVLNLMQDAEDLYADGASKKEWVLKGVESVADGINYDIDMEKLSGLIDELCAMSKRVNAGGGTGEC